jgi:hypothetical protein
LVGHDKLAARKEYVCVYVMQDLALDEAGFTQTAAADLAAVRKYDVLAKRRLQNRSAFNNGKTPTLRSQVDLMDGPEHFEPQCHSGFSS